MPEEIFWRSTPRKLNSLAVVYMEHEAAKNGAKTTGKSVPTTGYIDQIF
jgi:hypothetical protein